LDFYDSDVITGIYEKVRKLVLAEEKGSDAEGEQARKDLKAVKEAAEKAPVVKGNRKPLPVE
jgi:hypothetical protein